MVVLEKDVDPSDPGRDISKCTTGFWHPIWHVLNYLFSDLLHCRVLTTRTGDTLIPSIWLLVTISTRLQQLRIHADRVHIPDTNFDQFNDHLPYVKIPRGYNFTKGFCWSLIHFLQESIFVLNCSGTGIHDPSSRNAGWLACMWTVMSLALDHVGGPQTRVWLSASSKRTDQWLLLLCKNRRWDNHFCSASRPTGVARI